jgi:putative ABC transport system ATP-binding protein
MIKTSALQFAYPGAAPLHFPDVDVPQGATLLLRGPSGSGKSTWLALVAALVPPNAGSLEVAGQNLTALSRVQADAWRARTLGFLPQKLHVSAALTVAQNLGLAFWAAGVAQDRRRIDAALAAVGVAELAGRLPAQLSGGQAQRVALARAVLMQPRVIAADEPTASLDDDAAREGLQLLHSTAQRYGATLVIATHDARVGDFFAGPFAAVTGNVQTLRLPRLERLEVAA